jgi:D-alanyl-D-alanine carboxypeptidase
MKPGQSLCHLLLLVLLLGVGGILPAQPAAAAERDTITVAEVPQAAPIPLEVVAPFLGAYSPNTTIAWDNYTLWFIRPPFQSQLLPNGDGTYTFAHGWLSGTLMQFVPNESNGISVVLLSADGVWREFARSGEIYPDLSPELRRSLELLLDQKVADSRIPGTALYVNIPGQGMWLGARGLADQGRGIPMVPLDRFRIASATKTFVATVVLQLMQEGWLTLDDTVERWLPGMVPNGNRMNIRHLLNHTSGLYDYLDNGFVNRAMANPGRIWRPEEIVAAAVAHPPYFAPGDPGRWRYSNTNYILLGMIVERATGNPLVYEVRQRIINPLGLQNTFFDPEEINAAGVARGYVGRRDYTDINMSFVWAAGGMVSTAEDLGRFIKALSEGALLGPEALATMHSFMDVQGAWGSRDLIYGMGLMQSVLHIETADPYHHGVVRGHTGALTGYRTAMWYLPNSGITIVANVNQMYADPNDVLGDALDIILAHQ